MTCNAEVGCDTTAMPKRSREEGKSGDAAALDGTGSELAQGAGCGTDSPAAVETAAQPEWHVDYRRPLERWASQVLPPCSNSDSCADDDNFVKGVKWSPDGHLLLSNSEDHKLRVWALDEAALPDAWSNCTLAGSASPTAGNDTLRLSRSCTEAECIYDFCWYPGARAMDPASCCALSCSRDTPLHLWNVCSAPGSSNRGHVRATYRPYDHNDEVAAAMSCCFSPDGELIYCGFEHSVHVFQTARPGRDSIVRKTTPTRKARKGLKGLISTLAVTPDGSVYAAGSYGASVGLYSSSQGETVALLPASSGVTQVSFAPDGLLLMVGERKSSALKGWDIRHTAAPLFTCRRRLSTNQRLQFDIDPCSSYIATGDEQGVVRIYDIREEASKPDDEPPFVADLPIATARPVCCNSVHFHPFLPVLATGSGNRRFRDAEKQAEAEAQSSANGKGAESEEVTNAVQLHKLAWARGPETETAHELS